LLNLHERANKTARTCNTCPTEEQHVAVQNPDAYAKRLDFFRVARDGATKTLKPLYAGAVDLTEDALPIGMELVKRAGEKFEDDSAVVDQRLDRGGERLKRLEKLLTGAERTLATKIANETDRAIAEADLALIRATLSTDVSNINTRIFATGSDMALTVVSKLLDQLFDEIYYPDEGSFSLETVKQGLAAILSSIPFAGAAYSITTALYQISERAKLRQQTANDHVRYVEEYCEAIERWKRAAAAVMLSFSVP
jgi:hypothetical protein